MAWPISSLAIVTDLALACFAALEGSSLVASEGNLLDIIEFVDEELAIAYALLFGNHLFHPLCHLLDRLCCYS
jgi:hypothetical protein